MHVVGIVSVPSPFLLGRNCPASQSLHDAFLTSFWNVPGIHGRLMKRREKEKKMYKEENKKYW